MKNVTQRQSGNEVYWAVLDWRNEVAEMDCRWPVMMRCKLVVVAIMLCKWRWLFCSALVWLAACALQCFDTAGWVIWPIKTRPPIRPTGMCLVGRYLTQLVPAGVRHIAGLRMAVETCRHPRQNTRGCSGLVWAFVVLKHCITKSYNSPASSSRYCMQLCWADSFMR